MIIFFNSWLKMDAQMFLRLLIYACLLEVIWCHSFPTCLTGYMTDLQSWVDYNGQLLNTSEHSSIDVSFHNRPILKLRQQLHQFTCSGNRSVQYLSMAWCQFQQVPMVFDYKYACGSYLSKTIEYLTLAGNNFGSRNGTRQQYKMNTNGTDYWAMGFNRLKFPRLRELDLRKCGIQEIRNDIFRGMPNLRKLYLGENNIFFMRAFAFWGLERLTHLDLSRNNLVHDMRLHIENWSNSKILSNLILLDFSYTKLHHISFLEFMSFRTRLQSLSICHAGLPNIGVGVFQRTSLKYLDVSGNKNILNDARSLQGLEFTLKVLYANNVTLKSLNAFENFTSLEILKASNNEVSSVRPQMSWNLTSLQVLYLDMNKINTWYAPTALLMPNLKLLSLRNNNINLISAEMANDFQNVSYIGLSGNAIICNCIAREIFELALRNEINGEDEFIVEINKNLNDSTDFIYTRGYEDVNNIIANRKHVKSVCNTTNCTVNPVLKISGKIRLFDYNEGMYNCLVVETEWMSTSFDRVPTCNIPRDIDIVELIRNTWNKLYLLLIPMPLFIFGFIYRRSFRYFFLTMRNSAMLSLINKNEVIDESTIFNYDVFVSYCNEDRPWVLDHLLPHLETDCNVGLSILENIVSCMDRSKTIMLVISQRFLLSQWCQFEMHLAQHRLLETRREDLILVLLEDLPRRLRPNTLHYLMATKTYIVWPKEDTERASFWRRLKKSVVTHKMKQPENISLA